MEQGKTTLNVSPLLGISEPSLLLETVDQRIAYLRHQLETQAFPALMPGEFSAAETYYKTVLTSLLRQRDELMAAFAKVVALQEPSPVLIPSEEGQLGKYSSAC